MDALNIEHCKSATWNYFRKSETRILGKIFRHQSLFTYGSIQYKQRSSTMQLKNINFEEEKSYSIVFFIVKYYARLMLDLTDSACDSVDSHWVTKKLQRWMNNEHTNMHSKVLLKFMFYFSKVKLRSAWVVVVLPIKITFVRNPLKLFVFS